MSQRHVVAAERKILQHTPRGVTLPGSIQQREIGLAVDLAEPRFGRVPGGNPVSVLQIDKQVLEQAVLLDLLDIDGEAIRALYKLPLLNQQGRKVGADRKGLGTRLSLGPRLTDRRDDQGEGSRDQGDPHGRANRRPARDARSEDGRQLLLALQTRQCHQGTHEQADRNDDSQQLRHGQQRQLDHHPHALAALDNDFQLVEALAQNADRGQGSARADDGTCDLPEKIALNQGHMRQEIAGCRRRGGRASNTHPNA